MRTLNEIRNYLQSSVGQVLRIKEKRIWGNDVMYVKPTLCEVIGYTDNYIITNGNKCYKTCFNYQDFYSGNLTFEVVDIDETR